MITVHKNYENRERNTHVNEGFVSEGQDSDGDTESSDNSSSERLRTSNDHYYIRSGNQEPNNTSLIITPSNNKESTKGFSSERLKSRLSSRVKGWIQKQKNTNNGCTETNKDENRNNKDVEEPSTFTFSVVLHVDPKRHNYGRRATLSEVLFGIIPERTQQPDILLNGNRTLTDKKVTIKGFIPNGEAIKMGKLKIGDCLDKIDDLPVTVENIDDVLSTITSSKQVKLTIQRPEEPKSANKKVWSKSTYRSSLVQHITGDKNNLDEITQKYKKIPHVVMYLSTEATEKEGVLYQYPPYSNCLTALKGMFLTLSHVVKDVTLRSPKGSSLVIEETLIHAGYNSEGNEVLVLALPSLCVTQTSVIHMVSDITSLLKFQYLSLNKAFGDPSNKPSLDQFFTLYFNHYLSPSNQPNQEGSAVPHIDDVTNSVLRLPIPLNLEEQLEKLISGFESLCDIGCEVPPEVEENLRGTFVVLGVCFFYKGYLISNHLLRDHLIDIYLYAHHYQILSFINKDTVSQIMIWKEVYPTHFFKPKKELVNSGFTERDGKWFLLIVAMGHSLIGMILETGWMPLSIDDNAPVNPLLVRMTRNLLEEMDTSGIIAELEHVLEMGTSPTLVSADGIVLKSKSSRKLFSIKQHENEQRKSQLQPAPSKQDLSHRSLSSSTPSLVGNLGWPGGIHDNQCGQGMSSFAKRLMFVDVDRQHLLASGQGESDADLSLSTPSDHSVPFLVKRRGSERTNHRASGFWSSDQESQGGSDGGLYRGSHLKAQRKFASAYDLSNIRRSLEEVEDRSQHSLPQKLVCGVKNTLFHYVHFDIAEGVYLAPVDSTGVISHGPLHLEIVDNFHRCTENIHALFQHAMMGKDIAKNKEVSKFGFDKSMSSIQEQGVLFQCKHQQPGTKKITELSYWVVGRLFTNPEPREVYVCFEDGAPQNMVELAFRLAFGSSI